MKNLILALLLSAGTAFGANVIKLADVGSRATRVPHGNVSVSSNILNSFATLAEATVAKPDPHWFVVADFGVANDGANDINDHKGRVEYQLLDETGAVTASHGKTMADGVSILLSVGLDAAADDIDVTDPVKPLLHLAAANYDSGAAKITYKMSGKLSSQHSLFICVNNNATIGCNQQEAYGGSGSVEWTIPITIEDGPQSLPGGGSTTF